MRSDMAASAASYAGADLLRPFHLERSHLRGRAVRLGETVDYVLRAHAYPGPVSGLLGELLLLAGALAGGLKFDGTFSLQARGDGPVRLLVADCTNDGQMRGYAGYDEAAVAAGAGEVGAAEDAAPLQLLVLAGALAGGLKFEGSFSLQIRGDGPVSLLVADCTNDGRMRGYAGFDAERVAGTAGAAPMALLGKGVLALTIDQRSVGGELSQGIVELGGETLAECMLGYFERSEQVRTGIRVAVAKDAATDRWQAGAIVVQALPNTDPRKEVEAEEDWRRAMVLLGTATDAELLDPALRPDDVLFRLFHEDGVRVFRPLSLSPGCSCDEERVTGMLRSFPLDDIEAMRQEDGGITVTCQFCSRVYPFDRDRLGELLAPRRH